MKFTTTIIKARRTYQLLTVNVLVETAKDMFNLMSNINSEEIESFIYTVYERYKVNLRVDLDRVEYNTDDSVTLMICVGLDNLYVPNVDEEIIELLLGHLSYIQPCAIELALDREADDYLEDYCNQD
jgi:hypothetical protein